MCVRFGTQQQTRANTKRAGSAGCLHRPDPLVSDGRVIQTEQLSRDTCDEPRITRRGHIDLGVLIRQDALFGFADSRKDRGVAVVVLVDTDAQVDLVGIVICAAGNGCSQDRVRWQR